MFSVHYVKYNNLDICFTMSGFLKSLLFRNHSLIGFCLDFPCFLYADHTCFPTLLRWSMHHSLSPYNTLEHALLLCPNPRHCPCTSFCPPCQSLPPPSSLTFSKSVRSKCFLVGLTWHGSALKAVRTVEIIRLLMLLVWIRKFKKFLRKLVSSQWNFSQAQSVE